MLSAKRQVMDVNGSRHWFRTAVERAVNVALILTAAAVVWVFLKDDEPIEDPFSHGVSLEDVALLGDPDARVGLVEFSDFQSPFSGRFAQEILPDLVRKYVDAGRIKFGFKHLPLPEIHRASSVAAEMAACAYDQGMCWEPHSVFFRAPTPQTAIEFHERALSIGLTRERMTQCRAEGRVDARLRGDRLEAGIFGLRAAPTFLLGPIRNKMVRDVPWITETELELAPGTCRPPRRFVATGSLRLLSDHAVKDRT